MSHWFYKNFELQFSFLFYKMNYYFWQGSVYSIKRTFLYIIFSLILICTIIILLLFRFLNFIKIIIIWYKDHFNVKEKINNNQCSISFVCFAFIHYLGNVVVYTEYTFILSQIKTPILNCGFCLFIFLILCLTLEFDFQVISYLNSKNTTIQQNNW